MNHGKIKIAVISDIHYEAGFHSAPAQKRADISDILLLRAVHRINRFIHPDLTVILGDILDSSAPPDALKQLEKLRQTVGLLKSPWIVLPGNHDVDPDRFYSVFPRPDETTDINGVRIIPFIDAEEPGYNARRSEHDLARMKESRVRWNGPIITLQHVPVFPQGRTNCPFNYVNATEIVKIMRRNGINLALSGHYHEGSTFQDNDGTSFVSAPALCQTPFSFLEVDFNEGKTTLTRHDLRLKKGLNLWDMHVHTQFAYCSENMDIIRTMELAKDFGLAGLTFTEHSGQLYFDKTTYWEQTCLTGGIASALKEDERMNAYFAALVAAGCRPQNIGLETDCCFDGSLLLRPGDRRRTSCLAGSIHGLNALRKSPPDAKAVHDEFLYLTERLLKNGVDILAHPFRIFARSKIKNYTELYEKVIGLLKSSGTAAEINFHTQTTDAEFVRQCLAAGVKLTFGSDAHNLYEIGEFTPHLALLRECGFDGDLNDILYRP